MEAEKQLKEPISRKSHLKFGGNNISFVDNRPQAASQAKLISNIQRRENRTGLPDNLKTGTENLSGFSMDDVRVHYNSDKPAQHQALAYTQGADIQVQPGQEKNLSREVWHVMQQRQGRVQPTVQVQGVNINENKKLEKEADIMGKVLIQKGSLTQAKKITSPILSKNTIQLTLSEEIKKKLTKYEDLKDWLFLSSLDLLQELWTLINSGEETFTDEFTLKEFCRNKLKEWKMERDFPAIYNGIISYRGDNRPPQQLLNDKGFSWFDSTKGDERDRLTKEESQKKHVDHFITNFPSLSQSWIYPNDIIDYHIFCFIFPCHKLNNELFLKSDPEYAKLADISSDEDKYKAFRDLHLSGDKLRSLRGPMAGASSSPGGKQYGENTYKIDIPTTIIFKRIKVLNIGQKVAIYQTDDKLHAFQKIISGSSSEIY